MGVTKYRIEENDDSKAPRQLFAGILILVG